MSIRFGSGIRNTTQIPASGDYVNPARTPEQQSADWHVDATADTGTSHTLPGRGYLVLCEWCDAAFFAGTKAEALEMFRAHEDEQAKIAAAGGHRKWSA